MSIRTRAASDAGGWRVWMRGRGAAWLSFLDLRVFLDLRMLAHIVLGRLRQHLDADPLVLPGKPDAGERDPAAAFPALDYALVAEHRDRAVHRQAADEAPPSV